MAHSNQARKRIRQNEKARMRNKARLSEMKSMIKRFEAAVASGDKATVAELLPIVSKKIDKAGKTSVMHKNTAARRKSRMARIAAAVK